MFLIPNTAAIKFSTGSNRLTLIDISVLNLNTAISYAEVDFASSGQLTTYQDQEIRTRMVKVTTVTEELDDVVVSRRYDPPDPPRDRDNDNCHEQVVNVCPPPKKAFVGLALTKKK